MTTQLKPVLVDKKRKAVFPEHGKFKGSISASLRMTIPARDAVEQVSQRVDDSYHFSIPPKVVLVLAPRIESGAPKAGYWDAALRCANEPPFPGEQPNQDFWLEVDLTPCPRCGFALVWYESGHVPGYRVCAGPNHHHFIARPS